MTDKRFCKVTFYAHLTQDDKRFMTSDFAQTMAQAAHVDSIEGVSVSDPNNDHTEELLNALIDYISIGRNTHDTLVVLMNHGFCKSDLMAYGFSETDIDDVDAEEVELED